MPHQTLLFSATMPKEIEQLAAQYLNKPVKVKIGRVSVPTANVAQTLQRCAEGEKVELLVAMLQVGTAAWGLWLPGLITVVVKTCSAGLIVSAGRGSLTLRGVIRTLHPMVALLYCCLCCCPVLLSCAALLQNVSPASV